MLLLRDGFYNLVVDSIGNSWVSYLLAFVCCGSFESGKLDKLLS